MRTFVAIDLDEACRAALDGAVDAVRGLGGRIRWQNPETMHLTLKFIGELREERVPTVVEALSAVAARHQPFRVDLAGLSGFPRRGVPRVVFVGAQASSSVLADLQKDVDIALADAAGVVRESRRYEPHVTLGRVRDRKDCPTVEAMSAALECEDFGSFDANSFTLYVSELRPEGAAHTPLHKFKLPHTPSGG